MGEIPDLADSSWWSQSMRIQDMGQFATNEAYRVPESLEGKVCVGETAAGRALGTDPTSAGDVFRHTMNEIQRAYNALVAAGVPLEDARELMPLGAQHRLSWKLNIGALQHIVGKRGCWILQLGIWGPVIQGMISELVTKVDPIFGELVTPPCLEGDDFKGCIYHEENRRRYTGDDCHAPCPLHVVHHELPMRMNAAGEAPSIHSAFAELQGADMEEKFKVMYAHNIPRVEEMAVRAEDYERFWGRDTYSGRRLRVVQPT